MIYSIAKPARDVVLDYDLALECRRRLVVKAALRNCRDRVLVAYLDYEKNTGTASKIQPLTFDLDTVTALKDNYRLTLDGSPLDSIRDEAFDSTFHGLCPMCWRGQVAELDHYLPRSRYPEFSLLSSNLVPACERCNDVKANIVGSGREGRFFHALYDKVPHEESLLTAEMVLEDGVVARFSINGRLPDEVRTNAVFHFENLRLGSAYSSASAVEMLERLDPITSAYDHGGAIGVSQFAERTARSLRARFGPQYWKAALYDGIASSAAFCGGGFRLLSSR